MLGGIVGGTSDHAHAPVRQVVDGLLLGRVQVAGRDELGASALQREKQRDGLWLEVDPGPDREAGERPRLLEFVADRGQEPAAPEYPLDPLHQPKK